MNVFPTLKENGTLLKLHLGEFMGLIADVLESNGCKTTLHWKTLRGQPLVSIMSNRLVLFEFGFGGYLLVCLGSLHLTFALYICIFLYLHFINTRLDIQFRNGRLSFFPDNKMNLFCLGMWLILIGDSKVGSCNLYDRKKCSYEIEIGWNSWSPTPKSALAKLAKHHNCLKYFLCLLRWIPYNLRG